MIDIVVSGGGGRLGSRIVALANEEADMKATVLEKDRTAEQEIVAGRVLVECAPPAFALDHVERARRLKLPTLVATTGFEPAQKKQLEAAASEIPLIIAPNLSPGVTVLLDLVEKASRALREYDLELIEIHHRKKQDAPSGTAWAIARAAAEARGQDIERDAILARAGNIGPRGEAEIGIQTLRGGDVIGDHTLMLIGPTERIELTHRAATRDVFASGALRAVRFLAAAKPGLYSMKDVLGLS